MVAVGVGGAKLKCREKRLYTVNFLCQSTRLVAQILWKNTLRRVLTKSVFCCGTFCQIKRRRIEDGREGPEDDVRG
ncbi:hypothetical protein T4A_3033 [Trichinella pseudospiralis]|uniref:Uncharacterized protein n=1 Tax=Trichinella pseudospiralis TaxID=6337 RepID=A0A0V1EHY9_TRIPS|nr:hypothetical protein T4A_3033 [Trichinella pseudospiralis]